MKVLDQTTKDLIIQHATRVFADVGFKQATIRQICKSAKANVCLISYYFGGKKGLYRAIFEKIGQDRARNAEKILDQNHNIQSKEEYRIRLQMIVEQVFLSQVDNLDEVLLMNREMLEGMPHVADIVQQFISSSRKFFVDFIKYGINKDYLKKDLDPHITTQTLINTVIVFATQLRLAKANSNAEFFFENYDAKKTPELILRNISSIFSEGVLTK